MRRMYRFFLPRLLGAQLCAPFSIPPLNSLSSFIYVFFEPFPEAGFIPHARGRFSTVYHPSHAIGFHFAALSMRYSAYSFTLQNIWPELLYGGQWMDFMIRSPLFFICWYDFLFLQYFLVWGVPPFLILILLFSLWRFFFFNFRECSRAHCFARGSVLEYPEAVRARAMRRHLRNLGTCLFNCFFCILRCTPNLSFSVFIL